MSERKISYFNRIEVCGYVQSMQIKTFDSGTKLANIGIKDRVTNNMTYVTLFNRPSFKYGNTETTLEGLYKIFMDNEGKPRGELVTVTGKMSETTIGDKTYVNTTAFGIDPCYDETGQRAVLKLTGIVEGVKVVDDDYAKLKIGVANFNKDKDINGVDFINVVVRGDELVEKVDDKVFKGSMVTLACDVLNTLPERDRFGDPVGAPKKEVLVCKIRDIVDEDDLLESDVDNYKKAKKLGKGEVLKVAKAKDTKDVVAPTLVEFDDNSFDFD
jgi:hypothetical protein